MKQALQQGAVGCQEESTMRDRSFGTILPWGVSSVPGTLGFPPVPPLTNSPLPSKTARKHRAIQALQVTMRQAHAAEESQALHQLQRHESDVGLGLRRQPKALTSNQSNLCLLGNPRILASPHHQKSLSFNPQMLASPHHHKKRGGPALGQGQTVS